MKELPGRTFARRLREERGHAGLSQAALAEHLAKVLGQNINASAITRIEKHERTVKLDEALVIAELLRMPLNRMLRDDDSVDEQITELQRDLSQAEWRAAQAESQLRQAEDTIKTTKRMIAELETLRSS